MSTDAGHNDQDQPMTILRSLDEVPAFATEAEEAVFWATHEFSDELWESLPRVPDEDLPPVRDVLQHKRLATG